MYPLDCWSHALRFDEREGLFVNPVRRGPGGRRVHSRNDVDRLTVCIILRASGMPLPALSRYADLVGREPAITESLDLIRFKVGLYEDLADQGDAATRHCHAPSPSADEERAPLFRREAVVEQRHRTTIARCGFTWPGRARRSLYRCGVVAADPGPSGRSTGGPAPAGRADDDGPTGAAQRVR
ncbi:MerR family transcriptional regulator [Streptomyces sp. NPDC048438]|uniref:MerR family transcriptional regulator n=1 Tax=Streptomyces sp. NPDC048438 TaxID=3365551 RepID=UPI003712BE66